jgi:quercetin dioxygenase-like cupin family protein
MDAEQIQLMAKNLPPVHLLTQLVNNENTISYAVKDGDCFGIGLFNDTQVAVQRSYMSKGATFPNHNHREREYIVVYSGSVRFAVEPKALFMKSDKSGTQILGRDYNSAPIEVVLNVGDAIAFPAGVSHAVEALEDTWMIAITIPAAEGFPDGQ